ncbi:MAG: peptidyl-prolyl cis-trans isomerase [Phycisphaerae bacterium]|nr:peptidyl-prolyl cis-trans isomerase [Phycisphaerae bacterium]
MKPACAFLLVLASLAPGTGCRNAAGERLTLWEYWRSRGNAGQKDESRRASDDGLAGSSSEADVDATDVTGPPGDVGPRHVPSTDALTPSSNAIHSDALIVNDESISVSDVLEPILPTVERLSRELPPRTYYDRVGQLVRRQIIEAVAQHLIWRRAQASLDSKIEPQIDKAVDKMEKDRINREFGGSETKYGKYLAQRGKTRTEVRQRLRRSVIIDGYLREHLLPLVPPPRKQELLRYYREHGDEFCRPAQREMLLIDVPIAAFLDRRRPMTDTELESATAQARKTIQQAAEALKAGQPFEEVVVKYSRGVNKEKGGSWGLIGGPLRGRWAEPSKKLFEMTPGEISETIEAADSFFIVKVGRIEGGEVVSFSEAQPRISDTLRQERFADLRAEFLQEELEKSTIGSLDAFVTEILKSVPPPKGM